MKINSCKMSLLIQCANCGGYGHIYKKCNHPLISFGIICFRIKDSVVQYLMVQRKDSLSYVEFIRGKYDVNNKKYIMSLVSNMTVEEREKLLHVNFDTLWKTLWQTDDCKGFYKEYSEAKHKFELLQKGFFLKSDNGIYHYDIFYIMNNTRSNIAEPEWGFPKGRRNINESDLLCALREFYEETGLNNKYIDVLSTVKPFEEIFSGSNNIRYKHIYYVAECKKSDLFTYKFNPFNKQQNREIRDVCWFDFEDALSHIPRFNIERKELLKRIHLLIIKYIM